MALAADYFGRDIACFLFGWPSQHGIEEEKKSFGFRQKLRLFIVQMKAKILFFSLLAVLGMSSCKGCKGTKGDCGCGHVNSGRPH